MVQNYVKLEWSIWLLENHLIFAINFAMVDPGWEKLCAKTEPVIQQLFKKWSNYKTGLDFIKQFTPYV